MTDSWWTTGVSDAEAVLTIEKLEAAIEECCRRGRVRADAEKARDAK